MNMLTEATFNEPEEAEPLQKRLEAAGIHAEVHDERKLQKYWFLCKPLAGVHLKVEDRNYDAAHKLLAEWDAAEGALKQAIHCPACGSSRIEFPQFTRKFVSPSIYAVLCALHLFERKFYCEECHYTCPVSQKLKPRTDVLGWPVKNESPSKADRPPPS